ncbi:MULTISPECIES: cysteine desulfurase-like protein [unclassified Schlesneria]
MGSATDFPIDWCRNQFPALRRTVSGHPAAYFDGPGGSQVPSRVAESIGNYLLHTNANRGGQYATARESDELLESAHETLAVFLNAAHPESIIFGANMTTLTFALSRALSRTWQAGDEIVVTRLDHDGNVTPWVLAAQDAGAVVRYVDFHKSDCTLDLADLYSKLSDRTRLVAVGCASNLVGTLNPVQEICKRAHSVGAQVFLDAVHYAPHSLPDVEEWGCDWLACSAYKFFGPHVGVLYGKRDLLTSLTPYKLRPVTETLPGRWMTGTQNFEGIAGTKSAVEYLAALGQQVDNSATSLRDRLRSAYAAIGTYERNLSAKLINGLLTIPELKVFGLTSPDRLADRTPTVSFVHDRFKAIDVADRLGQEGLFVGHGNFYALQVTENLGLEPDGVIRVGLMHYNTSGEIDRLLNALQSL